MDLMAGYLGDAALVNGTPDADLSVAATVYRFRLLNGSNARIFRVAFEDGRPFQVIAGDGGLLERPVATRSSSAAERVRSGGLLGVRSVDRSGWIMPFFATPGMGCVYGRRAGSGARPSRCCGS
jgi:hypothetical protein